MNAASADNLTAHQRSVVSHRGNFGAQQTFAVCDEKNATEI